MALRRATVNPRVKIHDSGCATLSGVFYEDFRSIITLASLYNYQELKKEGDEETKGYREKTRVTLDCLKQAMADGICGTHPSYPVTREDRWREVRQERAFRVAIESILVDTLKEKR